MAVATEARERPILFSGPMVRAILDGRKTQTRRVVKLLLDQPTPGHKLNVCHYVGGLSWDDGGCQCKLAARNPYGWIGDRLWVRETFQRFYMDADDGDPLTGDVVAYRASCAEDGTFNVVTEDGCVACVEVEQWQPSIFMPRVASRITLEISDVRVERLRDIDCNDIRSEGFDCPLHDFPGGFCLGNCKALWESFGASWDSINGKRPGCAWGDNPWVWVIEFNRIQPD